jgi:hypothetical protein
MNWIVVVVLFTIITITIGFLIKNFRSKSKTRNAVVSIDQLVSNTGFDESKVVDTKTEKDPKTGATTVTSTDANGKKMSVTTAADGTKTNAAVTDKDGKTLGSQASSIADTIKQIAPSLLENVAAGAARDLVLIGGTKLLTRVSKEVSEKGVKSALQQGGKLVGREGADQAMKFLGYMSFTAASRASEAAAEIGLRKAAQEESKKVIDEALKKAGKKSMSEITDVAARKAIEDAAEKAAKEATKKAVEAAGKKVASGAAVTASERAMAKVSVEIAEKAGIAGARMATKAATEASMGPVGWALMAFDALSLALDVACCGGYCEVADTKTWEKQRDTFQGQVDALVKDANTGADGQPDPDPVRYPIITGPFDTLDSAALQQRVVDKVKAAMADANNSIVKATIDKLKAAITAGTVKTESDIEKFMDDNLDLDSLFFEATKNLCTDLLGKAVIENGKFAGCSWPDQAKCEASFTWGDGKFNKDTSIYSSWNAKQQECNKDPVAQNMRIVCDGAGFPFNKDKKICDLSKDYCLKKGLKWDGTNCKLEKGQELAEMMFGTTVVRGLNSLYSADQYEPCPSGSRPAAEMAALAGAAAGITLGGAAMAATYIGQTMCSSDKCPDGQSKVSGLCYDACKPGFDEVAGYADFINQKGPIKTQGMCYKCPDGYKKSSSGMCRREACDANLERGTGGGIGLCYPKCTDKFGAEYTDSNGMTLCLKKCPAGMDTLPLTCQRQPQTKTSASAQKSCPAGWSQSIAGPAGMCQQDCSDGYKKYGGLCYHPNVDTSKLSRIPDKGPCNAGDRDDGTSCFSPLKTSWDSCAYTIKGCKQWGKLTKLSLFNDTCKSWGDVCQGGAKTTGGTIVKTLMQRQSCPAGYSGPTGGFCYAVSKPAPASKPIIEVGQCNDASKPEGAGGMCYQKCSDFGPSFKRSAVGMCQMDAMTTSRDPKDRGAGVPFDKSVVAEQYAREPNGISYKVFPKKRKIPFGKGPNGC